jgi:hypothetical protein
MNDRIPVRSMPGNAHSLDQHASDYTLQFGRMLRGLTDAMISRPVPATEAEICKRLDDGEDYGEGTPLEAAILAHVRFTGQPIEYTDPQGLLIVLDDVDAMGGNA